MKLGLAVIAATLMVAAPAYGHPRHHKITKHHRAIRAHKADEPGDVPFTAEEWECIVAELVAENNYLP